MVYREGHCRIYYETSRSRAGKGPSRSREKDELQAEEKKRADEIKLQIAKIEIKAAKEQARLEAEKEQAKIEADKELALEELELKAQQDQACVSTL